MVDKGLYVCYIEDDEGPKVVLFPPTHSLSYTDRRKGVGPMIAIMLIGICFQAVSLLLQVLDFQRKKKADKNSDHP